jgi:hypothetical protein
MNAKDKSGQSREGSGRVAINKDAKIKLVHCYTLESNYHNGRRVNHLAPRLNKASGALEPDGIVTDVTSKVYMPPGSVPGQGPTPPPFTVEILEDVGHALCASILDLIEENPSSRIPLSQYKNIHVSDNKDHLIVMKTFASYRTSEMTWNLTSLNMRTAPCSLQLSDSKILQIDWLSQQCRERPL